MATTSLC